MNNIVTTNTNTEVVVVTAPGPSGPIGPQGPTGSAGTIQTNSGTIVSPFLIVNGQAIITGSLTVSGSNTFRNIGPALFTGSTGILGNLTVDGTSSATLFSGSGANLFDIPASGITGLNLSRVASGSVSASVGLSTNSFTIVSGSNTLFNIDNAGGITGSGIYISGSAVYLNGPTIRLYGNATLNDAAITTTATTTTDRIQSGTVTASVATLGNAFTLQSAGNTIYKISAAGQASGSFLGDGSGLVNIPASGIVGLNLSQIASTTTTASISAASGFQVNTNTGITGSLIVTAGVSGSFSGSFEGNGSGLTNVPASGIVGLNLSRTATGSVSASVNVGITSFEIVSGSSTLLAVDNTGLATISSSINIGRPSDGSYTTGFFDTFTTTTKVSDAIDEISAAFLDLAPAKAGILVGTNLIVSSPSVFPGYLAGGLNSSDWYVGTSAYSLISNLTSTTTVTLNTPDTSTRFRAGKNSDRVANTLIGGVSSSKATGSATLSVSSTRALTSGAGSTGTIQITDIAQYNTFWAKANARINDTLTVTGSYKYAVSADNGAGTTNTSQLWYVGGLTDFPNQTVTAATPVTSSTTFNYLSGIPYLKTATFTLGVTGSNLFNPVYNQNQISFTSTYFSTLTTGSNSPNFNDTLLLTVTRTLTSNLTSNQNFPTFTITGTKPNKSSATTSPTLVSQKVNSYTSAQSTNTTEYFLDEARRYGDFQTTSWDNTATLTDGNLQVQNGRLINGKVGDYTAFTTTTQEYFRALTVNSFASNGSFNFSVSGFSSISPWGSGGALEIAFAKVSDVTGAKTANILWDFGQAFNPSNVGAVRGIVVGSLGLSGTFTLGTVNSGNGSLILYIKYNNVTTANVISQFTVSMS
jgi:hypothetical protein